MAEKQETIEDIIAEMRMFKCRNLETGELELCNAIGNYFADRLEAAHKRDMSKNVSKTEADFGQLGNAAKLREAVLALKELDFNKEEDCYDFYRIIDAALAAPPRNCDVGSVEEQEDRFRRYCNSRGTFCGDCPLYKNRRGECRFAWAQLPYEEGDAK